MLGNDLEREDSSWIAEGYHSLVNEEPKVGKGDCMIRDLFCFVFKEAKSTSG